MPSEKLLSRKDDEPAIPASDLYENTLSVRPVDHLNKKPILVNIDRVTLCPSELSDSSWLRARVEPPNRKQAKTHNNLHK